MSASFIHWWRWLPCKVPTSTSGAVWGSVSCPWMLWHADQGNQTSDLQITRIWLYPWARAASRWRHQVEKLSNFQDHRGGTLECRVWLHLTVLFWFISLPKDTKKKVFDRPQSWSKSCFSLILTLYCTSLLSVTRLWTMRQHDSESTELLNKKVKGTPEFLQSEKQEWRRIGPWPFDGKQSSAFRKHKEMRTGRRRGTLTNLVGGTEAIMGLIRNQRGSVQRVKLVFSIWKLIFASHSGHLCLFVSQIYTAPWWEYGRFYSVVTRRDDQRLCGISAPRENKPERWVVLLLTMPQCAVYKRMSMSEGAGRGRAAFLSLEPGYPLPCPRSRWHVPCICSLVISCPLTQEIKTVRSGKNSSKREQSFCYS